MIIIIIATIKIARPLPPQKTPHNKNKTKIKKQTKPPQKQEQIKTQN